MASAAVTIDGPAVTSGGSAAVTSGGSAAVTSGGSAAVTDHGVLAIHLTESTVWGCRSGLQFDCPAAVYADAFGLQFGERAFVAGIADPESFEPYPVRYVDDEYLSLGDRVFPMDEVLAGVLRHVATRLGVRAAPDLVVLTHPAHWGRGRRRALVTAGRGIGKEVLLISVAEALMHWSQEPMPTGTAVVEVGFLDTTVSVPAGDSLDCRHVDCVHRGELGSSDVRERPDAVGEFVTAIRELCQERPPRVLVTGELPGATGPSIVEAIEAGWELPLVARTIPGSAVAAGALARGLELVAPAPEAMDFHAPAMRRPRPWWDSVGRWAPLAAAGLLVVAAVTAVFVVGTSADPPAGAESTPQVQAQASAKAGRVSLAVPPGWRERSERSGPTRVELVPENGTAARIVVAAQELTPGADLDAVANTLRQRMALRPETFGALEPADVDGRSGLAYREHPDPASEVRWSVFVEDGLQVSVGCQISADRWFELAGPCEQAVRSVVIGDG
ncbi:type VII secretion-associated protein [Rhodococcus sp. NPDC058481]|uniref:type VII secretion-associated protein n=1 Tax=unclassified Rhodococcus (in: high G+C Gram-positive bacteria) TaxID=192944 RepID=UPI003656658C